MAFDLHGKTAIVSGSTLGIGFATALGLARQGARVIVNGRKAEGVAAALERLRAAHPKGDFVGFPADLATAAGVNALAAAHPAVDIVVNNLGIFEPCAFEDIADEEWIRYFEVNVLSGIRLSRAYLPHHRKQNWGRHLFLSSAVGLVAAPEMIHYGLSKSAQIYVARSLAELVAGTAITVNSIIVGLTETEGAANLFSLIGKGAGISNEVAKQSFLDKIGPVIGRPLRPEEIANAIVYLASPAASGTTGAAIRVDGGVVHHV